MPASWLVLVHQLPPKPLYLRAKVRQRLVRVGALALKNSVYVLPRTDDALEDFQWIAGEARSGGGEAWVVDGDFVDGIDERALIARFRKEREVDWTWLAGEVRAALTAKGRTAASPERSAAIQRLRRRHAEIAGIDFYDAPGRKEIEAMLDRAEGKKGSRSTKQGRGPDLTGHTWVTRRGVKIDRIATAWLVRRFIDPSARFRFVDPKADTPRAGELRFDMVGGDFTHEGDRCTFETLNARGGVRDPALRPIAEIVHDIDLKDGRYGRPEAAGVRQLVDGLVAAHAADEDRLERGFALFDDLYASFRPR